jgi:membrane-associated phospholipid phosphatase
MTQAAASTHHWRHGVCGLVRLIEMEPRWDPGIWDGCSSWFGDPLVPPGGQYAVEVGDELRNSTIARISVGAGTLLGTAILARRPTTTAEIQIFRRVNELPSGAFPLIWVPMQYGTFATVPAATMLALARRRPRLALAIGIGGSAAWVSAKAVKAIVDRGRPSSILEGVSLRGIEEGDQGFPSGHAAVSAALTVVAWPYMPGRWPVTLAALSGFVPFARMYVGAHLPLDVIGGSALGLTIGSAVNLWIRDQRRHVSMD